MHHFELSLLQPDQIPDYLSVATEYEQNAFTAPGWLATLTDSVGAPRIVVSGVDQLYEDSDETIGEEQLDQFLDIVQAAAQQIFVRQGPRF